MIEKLTKRRMQVETMVWDGTAERAEAIRAWLAPARTPAGEPLFLEPHEIAGVAEDALLWVADNRSWVPLPVGYRVARDLNGSGWYQLSPEGAAAGYEALGEGA